VATPAFFVAQWADTLRREILWQTEKSFEMNELTQLLERMRACTRCTGLPLGPKPIFQLGGKAQILIAGQAPGRVTHQKGVPFDDPSGERLRGWLGVTREQFYDPDRFAIFPMGLCYPGTGSGGDLPPRPECAAHWRQTVLAALPDIELTITLGAYAHDWHLGERQGKSLTETVANWRAFWPHILPLPHPSPRNIAWFKRNSWFEAEVVPELRVKVAELMPFV
jgi:uracil-DNA glycosylase